MKKIFSVSEAAREAGMTAETLRHYDRIGLVSPCRTDEWTGYRYYSERELVQLSTVHALQCMGLSLQEIKNILSLDGLDKLTAALEEAMRHADEKIAELVAAKDRIGRAQKFYQEKQRAYPTEDGYFVRHFPKRAILLSDTLQTPDLDNLWDYHRHFYPLLGREERELFSFEDLAGVCLSDEGRHMFALCKTYGAANSLRFLPEGRYLCRVCPPEDADNAAQALKQRARELCGTSPSFTLQIVLLTGILHWNYEIQVPLEEGGDSEKKR